MTCHVLLPGAGGVAWYWHRVAARLREAGHEVLDIDLPGDDPTAGLAEYADIVVEAVGDQTDIVMVAQSMGAFTAALVARRLSVAALFLVNAMIPVDGERPGDWWDNTEWEDARVAAACANGYAQDFDLETYFLHDVPAGVAAAGESRQRDEAPTAFGSVCGFGHWPSAPLHVIAGADDRFFPLPFQRQLARDRLGLEAHVLPGGHLLALSQPDPLARHLLTG